ncbi:hypothetical protein PHLH7_07140 [Pseudomonas sp. Ost2]|uniref:phosphoribosyltransferase n=1 Tax=Pseudomonas sp. Ost2 TaxID=2678260 RepID=UPI001BB342B6|nr:phosphoribosyltransferase [Pseudomonas sp. Ost2]BBP74610.1 hypothetical protein PHLH7_07140 [Pseudomonas sp. Ost2]
MDKPVLPFSYEQLDHWVASLRSRLVDEAFACVVGILRGGAPLALMVSHTTGLAPAFLRYERGSRTVTWDSSLPMPAPGSKVLLCEDIAGAGHTLADCIEFLQGHGLTLKTMTAGFDDLSRIRPDYSIDGRGAFLLFPWERHSHTAEYRARWQATGGGLTGPVGEDHEYETYGIDLDGILLPDIAPERYAADLRRALRERDHQEPFERPSWLALSRVRAIITGRPEMDRERTRHWLDLHGYAGITLLMRDIATYDDSPEQVATHKAAAALQQGCTHFVESDAQQAILISTRLPLLRVIWWDALVRRGRLIGAHDWSHVPQRQEDAQLA